MNIYDEILQEKGYISCLAPMEGVTDTVFRQMIVKLGRPALFFTEFLNVEGFCSKGRDAVIHRLKFAPSELPLVVQLWGNVPEYYVKTLEYVKELNPSGIDINMGCSVHDVLSSGRGSGLIKNIPLARDIISAVKENAGGLPVSVKTRLGYDFVDIEGWIRFLLEQKLDMLTVHGRLSKEGYSAPSRWDDIGRCASLRDVISPSTLIVGNGDIKSLKQGKEYVQKYGLDGFMVGRYILNNPWIFTGRDDILKDERIKALCSHLDIYREDDPEERLFNSQKKYIKAYISGFDGANELRSALMSANSCSEIFDLLS